MGGASPVVPAGTPSGASTPSGAGTPSGEKSLGDAVGINRRFRLEDLGLVWETVESLHHFLYPGIEC